MLICHSSENATMLFSSFYHQLLVPCQQTSNQWDTMLCQQQSQGGDANRGLKKDLFQAWYVYKIIFFLLNKYLQLETRLCYVCEQRLWMDYLHHFTPTPRHWQTGDVRHQCHAMRLEFLLFFLYYEHMAITNTRMITQWPKCRCVLGTQMCLF